MTVRTVMHFDMDAYFASVEQQCTPVLRGKPIAVIGSGARTVVTTASYEARTSGVKTGMTVFAARRLCPEIIFVEGNNARYTDTCAELAQLYRQFTPLVEVFSVDEAFLDVTRSLALFGSARSIAQRIKAQIRDAFGLTCSAGIAPNKLLAKLASDLHKPDGLFEIAPAEVSALFERLPVSKLCGIGAQLAGKLSALGIRTCGELGRTNPTLLRHQFGIVGEVLHRMGRGEDESPVVALGSELDAKSIGHSMTFCRDIFQQDILEAYLLQLVEMVCRRVRNSGFVGRTVSLTIRYADFTTFTRQHSLREPAQTSLEMYRTAKHISSIHSAAEGSPASGCEPLQPEQACGTHATFSR